MEQPLLEVRGISKSFPGVKALQGVEFHLDAGEVLVLVGENGAGKSTLMKILSGIYQRDEGSILVDGHEVDIPGPNAAKELGIRIIHQEMHLMPDLTVAQNIYLGREPRTGPMLDEKALNRQAGALLTDLGIPLDPRTKVSTLTVAAQQMVEIAKALSVDARVLIMDEPTSALTDTEVNTLFGLIDSLRAKGTGIIYISHRMEELQRLADRVTVLRDGQHVGSLGRDEIEVPRIIEMMVGRAIDTGSKPEHFDAAGRDVVLRVTGLSTRALLEDVCFELHRGEILGFAGLMGAGRTETARAIIGADPSTRGTIEVGGRPVRITQPADAVRHGIGYLSEDRKGLGLMLEQTVTANTIAASLPRFTGLLGIMNDRKARRIAQRHVEELRTRTPSVDQPVKLLSGGNQQKVVIAKWLVRDCDILIVDEPTRGIDVGAKEEIYRLLQSLAADGKSIIVISSELPEVLRLSHRIAVMANGRIAGTLTSEEATQESIMDLATRFDAAEGAAA
ncbi:MAG: sugar ABC transporter ATP-binding protein [Brachybacterium sp.]|uniref:sugar ABC transporter ATP-binding protein n=1 Tax=Brachybacterium sp. TaxID=1891286 RepID=UPI0026482C07|nr:sugar ABC transporter ATP-binding protein [Brachybacterium sp.]MDN5688581.1 sugar ABC transporter ATP-binding protein [Brachybacterium sp.]